MERVWANRVWAGAQDLSSCPPKYKDGTVWFMAGDIEAGRHTLEDLRKLVEGGTVTSEEYKEITGEPCREK